MTVDQRNPDLRELGAFLGVGGCCSPKSSLSYAPRLWGSLLGSHTLRAQERGRGCTLTAAGRGQVVLPEGPWVGWLQGLVITAAFVDGRGWLSFLRLHLPESTGGTLCGCTFFILLPYQDESCIYHF